jgi:transcriptional regulator GlxA family with amidase domain
MNSAQFPERTVNSIRRDLRSYHGEPIAVAFLLIPNFALMSYASAIEPFRAANTLAQKQLYAWMHISVDGRPVQASNGVAIACEAKVGDALKAARLFVCAGGNPARFSDAATFQWLKRLRRQGVAIGGVSGGPYLLARAGLLDDRRFTIHWEHVPALIEEFPHLKPTQSLFVLDHDRMTCAGGVAALDMMHGLIEADSDATWRPR